MKICAKNGRIHFIGVGGISMSALAKWCVSEGYMVSGSDAKFSDTLLTLSDFGVKTYAGENPDIVKDCDLVVYSSAIPESNRELCAAKKSNVKTLCRHEFLGEMQREFWQTIAVSGTHGKTTASAIIASIFKNAGKNFTAHVGGECDDIGGNLYSVGKDFFITEACEYKRSFLSLRPNCLLILNIESDHPDCYADGTELQQTFSKFVENLQKDGFIVINGDVEYSNLHICENQHTLTFGLKHSNDCYADNIIERSGKCEYDVILNGEYYARISSALYGRHNVYNALAAILVADAYKIGKEKVVKTLENFKGVKRRFETVAEINGARVIIDYAHHPSEIEATIAAAKLINPVTLRVYFQPHTYSRTAKYFTAFAKAFEGADEVNLLPTYAARETADKGVTSFELFYYINANYMPAKYFDNFICAASNITKTARPNDVILILGAGDINEIARLL